MVEYTNLTELEKQAQELVDKLAELHAQIGSYKTAKDELNRVSENLQGLVGNTEQLTQASHGVIQNIQQMIAEGREIVNRINESDAAKIATQLDELKQTSETSQKTARILLVALGVGFGIIITLQIIFYILGQN